MTKLKFKSNIFKSSNKSIFYIFFLIYKNVWKLRDTTKKGKLQKKLVKDIKIFLKKKKKQQYAHERYKNLSEGESNKVDKWIYKKML